MSETTSTRKPRRGLLRAVTRRFGTWPLFGVILVWVVLALVVFTVLGWLWGEGPLWSWQRWLTNWRGAGAKADSLDLVKVSLTTIGGIGGTGYLVIKYRERASAERADAEQRLLSGVQQLGSGSPQVRIAGVYSLADVADTYRGEYRQRVVSILCGYLRTQRGEWRTIVNEQDGPEQSSEEKVYVSHDGAVESTVLEVLVRHLRKRCEKTKHREAVTQLVEDDQLWCDCTIDLHDAVLTEIADFGGATFNHNAHFQGATFTNDAHFRRATFNRYAHFGGATFNRYAHFGGATFTNANFERATFNRADFWGATFTNANFERATFTRADFLRATFTRADFLRATFTRYADFGGATFTRYADFGGATFTNANFERATFNRYAHFRGATFTNDAHFGGATFNRYANFQDATFTNANFERATFTNDAHFEGATFTNANFERATFTHDANFQDATFTNDADFEGATFSRSAPPKGLPPGWVDEDGLPHGARWADADDEGLEAGSPDDAPAEGTGPGSAGSAAS